MLLTIMSNLRMFGSKENNAPSDDESVIFLEGGWHEDFKLKKNDEGWKKKRFIEQQNKNIIQIAKAFLECV